MSGPARLTYAFAPIPEWILYHPALTPLAVRVYGVLARCGMTPDACFPSHAFIAEKANCQERSVARPMAELEAVGAIRHVTRWRSGGGRTSNGYWLAGDGPLEQTAQESAVHTAQDPQANRAGERAINRAQERVEREPLEREQDKENVQNVSLFPSPRPINGNGDSVAFGEFWKIYPRKESKGSARKAWSAAVKKAKPDAITAAAQQYRDKAGREDRYTKLAATWLNGECWDDPVEVTFHGETYATAPETYR